MTLNELIYQERQRCPNTSSAAWLRRCEEFHYAKLSSDARKASFAGMLAKGRDPADVEALARAADELSRRFTPPPSSVVRVRKPGPAPAAQSPMATAWTLQHDAQLAAKARSGATLEELSAFFGRPVHVLEQRLQRLASAQH